MVTRDGAGRVFAVRSVPPEVWARQTAQLRALGAELQRHAAKPAGIRRKPAGRPPTR